MVNPVVDQSIMQVKWSICVRWTTLGFSLSVELYGQVDDVGKHSERRKYYRLDTEIAANIKLTTIYF